MAYYDNVNQDLLICMNPQARSVLELGCGAGALAQAYKTLNSAANYVGVELFPEAAQQAEKILDHVLIGDLDTHMILEDLSRLTPKFGFDLVVCGDILEHLKNPWGVLRRVHDLLAEQGECLACLPNVGHWSVVAQLLGGQWNYADQGLLDRTHLRFFTLDSIYEMFRTAGYVVTEAVPRVFNAQAAQQMIELLLPTVAALGHRPDRARQSLAAYQWVVRAQRI